METIHFAETQYFSIWFWILIIGVSGGLPIGLSFLRQVPQWLRWMLRLLGIGIPLMCYLFAGVMITTVDDQYVHVSFGALRLLGSQYSFSSIKSAVPRQYSPNKEYGGYGMKGTATNRALNASGDSGVQLVLKGEGIEGDRVLIGSQRSSELAAAINEQLLKGEARYK